MNELFEGYDSLGFMMPYYLERDERLVVRASFKKILAELAETPQLDPTAVIEIISRYRCFGDRTLVRGLFRTPWMARPTDDQRTWQHAQIPAHGQIQMTEDDIASHLFALLKEEIMSACSGKSTIGILLSGGMDSRIVAGTLDTLIRDCELSAKVVAITWGLGESRDVQYARRIAKQLDWAWLHFPLTPEDLLTNIGAVAERGCEYSPVHLHAMMRVRELTNVEIILGASFGDSVGRGEYAGHHVTELRPMTQFVMNWFNLLKRDAFREGERFVDADIDYYRKLYPREEEYQNREIEQQAHYWRRQLNPCMSVINEQIPFYQVFSEPKTYGFMWSLSPQCRNDKVYSCLFNLFASNLLDIPWARTGKPYLALDSEADSLAKQHHRYGQWIREDLRQEIEVRVLSPAIEQLGIFNMIALKRCLRTNQIAGHSVRALKLDEVLIWLAALSDFAKVYNIGGTQMKDSIVDRVGGALLTPLQVLGHEGVNRLRGLS